MSDRFVLFLADFVKLHAILYGDKDRVCIIKQYFVSRKGKRMDFLNNSNTVVGLIGGLITIIASTYAFITYVRNKAFSAMRKQTIHIQASQSQSSYQMVSKSLSKLDWMEVLWYGLEDCFRARQGSGVTGAFFIGALIAISIFMITFLFAPNAMLVSFIIFGIPYALILLSFYAYFVGRRVEQKIADIN